MPKAASCSCIQAACQFIDDANEGDRIIKKNVKHHLELLDMLPHGATPIGKFPDIIVYPEFSLQGIPSDPWTIDVWRKWLKKVSISIPGDVSDSFAKKSVEHNCYQQVCIWEKTDEFPGHYFETVFITDPKGKMPYFRRRLTLPPDMGVTTLGEIYTEYMKKYGPDPMNAFFPVLETPFGCLGGMMCCEMSTPEIARGLMLNGAEILLHSTSESDGWYMEGRYVRDFERRIRARDNCCYLISTNIGKIVDCRFPPDRDRGRSEIIDFMGSTVTWREFPGEGMIIGTCDVNQLRKARLSKSWAFTTHGQVISEIFQGLFKDPLWPKDMRPTNEKELKELDRKLTANLRKKKILRDPS
ncbi:MAG: hypothetical protein JRN20_17555 [Nitrososphaerota archaeon]|nr:hypothetical protein [Nitrososphaerota archaeon]MDG6923595.1 hypothetical protein [Nitrososphaerota archaeon]